MAKVLENTAAVPFRQLDWKTPCVKVARRADGTILLASGHLPGEAPHSIAHLLLDRSTRHPDRAWMRQRPAPGAAWRTITYGAALRQAEGIAQFLLDRNFGPDDAVLVITGNSIAHAVLMLGCYTAGVPVVPLSPAFATAVDLGKLLDCAEAVRPRLVFAQSDVPVDRALDALGRRVPTPMVVTADGSRGIALADIAGTQPTDALSTARDLVGPATIAEYLFTSGSTGRPKAVPQTHGMMTATIAALEGLRPDGLVDEPQIVPVTLEWMPWSHLSAGNIGFNGVLWSGGTIYLDDGKPVRGLFETTIANLREVSPVVFASAPAAFAMLADAMERDDRLRASFFRNLRYMAYGGATLSDDLYSRLQSLAVAETGSRVPLTTMYGSTETQGVTMTHWITERGGLVGLPLPGITLKLVPNGAKLEVRAKGATVASGYLGDPERSAAAFDEEGYYRLGDAVRFIDDDDPAQGLIFDGRVAEDFKLDSGTWVSVGVLRPAIVAACTPWVLDAVVAGHDRPCVGALLWPSPAALAGFAAPDGSLAIDRLAVVLDECLAAYNRGGSTSRRIARFSVLGTPPSVAAGELTDKGYVNQRAALDYRAAEAMRLFAEPAPPGVTIVGSGTTGRPMPVAVSN